MTESAKRLLTDDLYNAYALTSQFQTSSATPDELTQRLRNAGARVRKSVTEGYRTTPSSFSKAQSTGSIFLSMNDTLRDVYDNASGIGPSNNVTRKRARSVNEGQPESITEEYEISVDVPPSEAIISSPLDAPQPISNRQIKSLRAPRRAFLETRSLPAGALSFAGAPPVQTSDATPAIQEDDWSQENCFQVSQPGFEPMVFD